MASLWPGVGVENENARKESVWRGLDKPLGVAAPQADVGELLALEAGKRRRDAVKKRLATHDPHIRISLRLLNQMFPGAEADLKPNFAQRGEGPPCGQRLRRDRKQGQRFVEQAFLAGAKSLAPAASVEPATGRRTIASTVHRHRLRWARRRSGEGAQRVREIGLFPGEAAVGFRRAT